ncbi:MAG TPA: choice-of-anchor D domain-containing protein [Kofleriaceae bacterium]|nr:choice-of-anchor D domain-containing protein [Kofleriaceae bacterium]
MTGSPDPVAFGSVRVATESAPRSVALDNSASDPAENVTCAINGAGAADFAISPGTCPDSIGADASATVMLVFTPSVRGARSASLRIDYEVDSVALSETVALTGTGIGPIMVVTVVPSVPPPIDFGSTPVGTPSATTRTFRVQNTGDDVLDATLGEGGANPGDWTYQPSATSFLVNAGGTRDIVATFTPQAFGGRTASVTLTDADGLSSPASRSFDLTGVATDAVDISISPTALTFGAVDVQTDGSVTKVITVGNPGSLALRILEARLEALDGTPYADVQFTVLTAAPFTVPPGEELEVAVNYRPTVESPGDYAVLVLETNVVDTPQVEISLTGRGIDRHIEVSPPRVDFGPIYRNPAEPPEVTLEVRNTGDLPLVLGGAMREGDGAASFAVVGELADVIEPGDASSLVVQFSPVAASERPLEAALVIVNDDDASPAARVDLTGMGVLPPLLPSHPAIDWGSVAVGLDLPPPDGAPFTIRNDSGADSFVVQEVRVVDDQGQPLEGIRAVGLGAPLELAPGAELDLDVAFAPESGGTFQGLIEVLVDADPQPVVSVPVSGVAVDTDAVGGGGCAAAGGRGGDAGGAGGAWMAALIAAAIAVGRRRRLRGALVLALAGLGSAATARAQVEASRDLDLGSFRPVHAVDPVMVTVESNDVGESGSAALGVSIDYARNPLVLRAADGEMVDHPVSSRMTTELGGALAFGGGRFEVSAVVPLVTQTGDAPQFSAIQPADGSSLGDVRVHGKVLVGRSGRVRFGVAAELTLPTAADEQFAGAAGPNGLGRLLLDYRHGRLQVAVNGGALMRERVRLADVEQGHEAQYGAAAAVQVSPRVQGVAELFGALGLGGGPSGARPLEGLVAGRVRVTREVGLLVGGGRGILAGVGAPELRVFLGLAWSPGARPIAGPDEDPRAMSDDDHDGVVKRDDLCPEEVEDLDGFQDADGCPDRDDDGDGVADLTDRCPRKAEDEDDFADDDGCPDKDNDGDGVLDAADRCPIEAEDMDEFEDADGCPDPDNDGDGVLDAADHCAAEPETINGNKDDDGCPDPGEGLVLVTADRLEILEPIRFRGDGSVLTRGSQRLLGQVAATLRAHREILRVRVRAHVQPRGSGDEALSVARAKAVRSWLVEWGIESDRVEGVGFGSRQQLLGGKDARARAMNDRIELEIVERRARR